MAITNKQIFATAIAITSAVLLFYFTPFVTPKLLIFNDTAADEATKAADMEQAKRLQADDKRLLSAAEHEVLAGKVAHQDASKAANAAPVMFFQGNWSLYIDNTTAEYAYLIDKYADSAEDVLVDGDNVYIRNATDDGIEFTKLTKEHRQLSRHEPLNVYGMFLQQLNELEGYGDWSYEAERLVRKLFSDYFSNAQYSINTMQCREKTCLIEFSFTDFEAVHRFIEYLREHRKQCRCIPAETIWPDLKQAVVKIDLL